MDTFAEKMEVLFQEKILLFQEIADCLKSERDSLMQSDVEALWQFSDKKHDVSSKIEAIRNEILDKMTKEDIVHSMTATTFNLAKVVSLLPDTLKKRLKKFQFTLDKIKPQVASIAQQNKQFVEEYLKVIDELVVVISDVEKAQTGYERCSSGTRISRNNILLHREV